MPPDVQNNTDSSAAEKQVWMEVVSALEKLSVEARQRILKAVLVFYALDSGVGVGLTHSVSQPQAPKAEMVTSFSEDRSMSPKEFLHMKAPKTEVERVACLAYYLTHYRGASEFKTLDISMLNTEAAQLKFSNAAVALENAAKVGLLVPASKGYKQISALGERYIMALPDRDAAKAVRSEYRPKKENQKDHSKKAWYHREL